MDEQAGAVPIYKGAPNIARYLPGGRASAIFVEDFQSYRELGEFVRKVGADEALWDGYRAWARRPVTHTHSHIAYHRAV